MYFVLIFLMIFFTWRFEFKGKKIKFNKGCYLLLYLLFVLISGFRYRLGVDSVMYEDAYKAYPPLAQYVWGMEYVRDAKDIFWAILNSACRTFSNSFVLVQVVMALFVNGVMFWFVRKHSSKPFLAILLYFFTLWPLLTFEALREAMAVAFFIFALDSLIGSDKSILKYYLRVWPAVFFHTFGFMTLLFPLIMLIRPSKMTYLLTLIVSIVVITMSYVFSDFLLAYSSLSTMVDEKMAYYLESDLYGTNVWSLGGLIAIIFGNIVPIVLLIYVLRSSSNTNNSWYFSFLIILLIISCFRINLPLVYRFFNYFYIILIISMTECISLVDVPQKRRRLAYISTILFLIMILHDYSVVKDGQKYPNIYRYYPYNSIFTKDINPETESLLPL